MKRINHPKGYSQSELSHLLGYKNGQFISNVERALCNIPLKMLGKVSEVLEDRKHLLVSAPTGTGKTAASLIPALKFAITKNKPALREWIGLQHLTDQHRQTIDRTTQVRRH